MLKKIELYGFKSFADRIEVDFGAGVTCIVGPNGCGKSNVSDAIRWVLGEQSSKALRGTNMQDVIFKGTDNRKNLSYCEVSLVFDNCSCVFPVDYKEVVLGRRLYRSGESIYFINKAEARLKDITTLLYDSGIDRDGLTIIGQGQVTEIINSKPESRRGIFEEAAGIAKFKARKVEAERKLERVAAELDRVNIVIAEIDRTLGPLIRQAEAARTYLELRERLKTLDINYYIHSYDNAAQEKQRLNTELEVAYNELEKRQEEISELGAGSASALDQLRELDTRAEEINAQILSLSIALERNSGQERLMAERRARMEIEESTLENARAFHKTLTMEKAVVDAELERVSAQFERARAGQFALEELKSRREKLLGRRETIQNLIQSGEGYRYSVKKIIEESNRNSTVAANIVGVVATQIEVPEYLETAIEVALGAAAQNIITESEDNARIMIDLLSRNNWGRATFLPISAVRGRGFSAEDIGTLNQLAARMSGAVVGVGADLIKYNPKITPVIQSLLGRVVVVDGIDNAIRLARASRYAFKVVTLDGDVIETRGSITGGSKNALNNNLWHNNNLKQIEAELENITAQISKSEGGTDGLAATHDSLTQLKIKSAALDSEITATQKTIDTAAQTLDAARGRDTDAEGLSQTEAQKRLDLARAELAGLEEKKAEYRTYISVSDERRTIAQDQARSLHERYYKTQAALEHVDRGLNDLQEHVWAEYGLNYSSCYPFRVENFNPELAKIEAQTLRREIAKLGPINLEAIEQSKEAGERYESYTTQVTDLVAARDDLMTVIADLSREMESKFKSDFDKINENFGIVFRELFGGGRARLELSESGDYLNSGIEIIAEPPGKKLQNITLLSGGEKALTAIAILFAILKLKAMPFCLLDEIEAALDEANVARFANYLRRFTGGHTDNTGDTTQFIVITHRKPTMELADNLYGVTMEERGISKLVSVKLEQYA